MIKDIIFLKEINKRDKKNYSELESKYLETNGKLEKGLKIE